MSVTYPIDNHRFSSTSALRRISLIGSVVARGIEWAHYPVTRGPDEFSEYETYDSQDWDGYGAAPITKETVQAARAFQRLLPMDAPRPDIAPGGDGTIGFEWRSGSSTTRIMILVDIGPSDVVTARRVHQSGRIETLEPTYLETGARALIKQLFS